MAETKSDITILAIVGSLRAESINRKIAELAAAVAPEGVSVTVFEGLGELPFYNEDLDPAAGSAAPEPPAPVAALRAAAAQADAALVVTPEYNGSIPGVVKNAIDWLSRPFGDGALKDKPLAVIGGAFGRYGGVWGHDETRKSFGIAGARVVEALKLSVPFQTLEGNHPAENAELTQNVRDIVGKLAAEVG
ncbi:NAD(P)H-dependent oxidoreductase [Mycobacterium sp. 050134]|uniref:NAD(P)H-dependent oxidoreductase n=1 Tax=Mycobacterium sp. 050134 TaxID=3096111 RepID=UPI002ED7846B